MSDHPPIANAFLRAALDYAARGWPVLPLQPGGKAPLTPHGFKDATTDVDQIRVWWTQHPEANVAIRTGCESKLVVLDVDRHGDADGEASLQELQRELGPTPDTLQVRTPNGGRHLYFCCNGRRVRSRNGLRPGLDLKADGGYVAAPPSVLQDNDQAYVLVDGRSPSPAPAWLIEQTDRPRLSSAPPSTPARQNAPGRYAARAVKLEAHAVRTAAAGARNDTLNRAAFSLGQLVGGGHLDRAQVESELASAAAMAGLGEREAQATIRSGVEAGMKEPRTIPARKPNPLPFASTPRHGMVILIPGPHRDDQDRYIEQTNKTFVDQVLGQLPRDRIYRKSHLPGEILGQAGRRRWEELTPARARLIMDEHLKLGAWHQRKDETAALVYKPSTQDHANLVIAAAQQDARVRELSLLVSYPAYGPGFRRAVPGWRDGIYYDEPTELKDLEPERDIQQIQEELHELIIDFPFKDEASRQNFIGLLLTPLVAPAIDGNRPLHLLLSPLERTGKTKLAEEVLGGVILGRQAPALQITDRDEERDKRLLALLLQGETVVHLDNLPPTVDSGALASVLTATTYQGRILGASRIVSLPNTLTVVGSGNNTECSGEIAKRTVPILLQPRTAHPEARRDFLHPDLRGHIQRTRKRILAVLLGMIENWLAQGRPLHENRLGGFEAWSETIGGILHANCFNQWRKNESEWRQAADPVGQEWETFVAAWWEQHGAARVTVADLMDVADGAGCFQHVFSKRTERGRRVAFGSLIRRRVDTPVGDAVIRRQGSGTHSLYLLQRDCAGR